MSGESSIDLLVSTKEALPDEVQSKANGAISFLQGILKHGALDSKQVKLLAEQANISMTTIKRIKGGAGVVSSQQPDRTSL